MNCLTQTLHRLCLFLYCPVCRDWYALSLLLCNIATNELLKNSTFPGHFSELKALCKRGFFSSGKTNRAQNGRTPAAKKRQKKTVDDSDLEEPSPRPLRTPRSVARPPKPGKSKSTNQKRRKMPVLESDEDDSLELFDLGEEEEEKEDSTGMESNNEENVNPNVANKKKTNGSNSQKRRNKSQSSRKWGRRRVSSTWQHGLYSLCK